MAEVLRQGIHRGTVALVTGGGTGIGRAVALDLARCGADIVICGRRREPSKKAAAEIEALGARALAVPADIRDDAAVRHLVDSALERFGRIDTLVFFMAFSPRRGVASAAGGYVTGTTIVVDGAEARGNGYPAPPVVTTKGSVN